MPAESAVVEASHRQTVWNSGNYGTTLTLALSGVEEGGRNSCLVIRPCRACLSVR